MLSTSHTTGLPCANYVIFGATFIVKTYALKITPYNCVRSKHIEIRQHTLRHLYVYMYMVHIIRFTHLKESPSLRTVRRKHHIIHTLHGKVLRTREFVDFLALARSFNLLTQVNCAQRRIHKRRHNTHTHTLKIVFDSF